VKTSKPAMPLKALYEFKGEALLPGDILLSTIPSEWISIGIRFVIQAPFSHAAIFTKPPMLIEADTSGVRPRNILGIGVRNPENVCLLRLSESIPNAISIAESAAQIADTRMVRSYGYLGALMTLLPVPTGNSVAYFCSHLVADAYARAGLKLLSNKNANKITPKHLLTNSHFRKIPTPDFLIRISQDHLPTELDAIDEGLSSSPIDAEVKMRQNICSKLEYLIGKKRKDLLKESKLKQHGILSYDKADRFNLLLGALIIIWREDPKLASSIDAKCWQYMRDLGFRNLPRLIHDAIAPADNLRATRSIIEQMDAAQIQFQIDYLSQCSDSIDIHLQEITNYAEVVKECSERTELKTFSLLTAVYLEYRGYLKDSSKVIKEICDLLKSRRVPNNPQSGRNRHST
jgi:hypothetical protein